RQARLDARAHFLCSLDHTLEAVGDKFALDLLLFPTLLQARSLRRARCELTAATAPAKNSRECRLRTLSSPESSSSPRSRRPLQSLTSVKRGSADLGNRSHS